MTDFEPYREPQILTLTSDHPITKWDKLVEQEGQIGWLYYTKEKDLSTCAFWESDKAYVTQITDSVSGYNTSFCDKIKNFGRKSFSDESFKNAYCVYVDNANINYKYFRPGNESITNINEFKEWLTSIKPKFIYHSTETEFVPLPIEEQNTIRALSTYYPTTVITVEGGEVEPSSVSLTYIADTKNYIDNKLKAINAALVNTQKALL